MSKNIEAALEYLRVELAGPPPAERMMDVLRQQHYNGVNIRPLLVAAVLDGDLTEGEADQLSVALGVPPIVAELQWLDTCDWCGRTESIVHDCTVLRAIA